MNFKELALLAEDDFMSGIEEYEKLNNEIVWHAEMDFCRGYHGTRIKKMTIKQAKDMLSDENWLNMVSGWTEPPRPMPTPEEFISGINQFKIYKFEGEEHTEIFGKTQSMVEHAYQHELEERNEEDVE